MSSTKAKSAAQHRASGFSLDYTCALSVRKGRPKIQARAGAPQKKKEGEK